MAQALDWGWRSRCKSIWARAGRCGCRSKHLDTLAGQRFGYVITLCDRVREVCPEFPGQPQLIHWSIADPAGQADAHAAFRRVAADLLTRIGFLLARIGK